MPNDPRGLTLSFCFDDTAYQFSPPTYHSFLVGFEAFINRFANKNVPVFDHYNSRFGSSRQLLYSNFLLCGDIQSNPGLAIHPGNICCKEEKKIECD